MTTRSETPIQLQERDFAVLLDLFECRVMTAKHIAAINFNGKSAYAKKRIQKLKEAGLINERPRLSTEPSSMALTERALECLRDEGKLSSYPWHARRSLNARTKVSDFCMRHELAVMDTKAAFHSALRHDETLRIEQFSTWPSLHEFESFRPAYGARVTTVRPDGFIRIREHKGDRGVSEHTFFLEVDRSTESQDILATRAGCYFDFYRSGGFAVKNGAPRSAYAEYPFRVLMVFKTAERRNNVAERLLQNNPPILTQAYLTTFDEVTRDPFGPIWLTSRAYRDATMSSPFEVGSGPNSWGYKKNSEREAFVENRVKKSVLLV